MNKEEGKWLLCPVCHNKTRVWVREDTEMKNFPLFCPKCKQEKLINLKDYKITMLEKANT